MQHKEIFTNGKFIAAIATLCCLLWGSAYPGVKSGYILFNIDDIPSKLVFAGLRFTAAGLILLVISMLNRKSIFRLSKKRSISIFFLALIQTTSQYVFFYIGLANTTGVKSSIMNSAGTFFSVFLAHFIYKNDRLNINKAIGCALGFVGVMAVNFSTGLLEFSFSFTGEGFIIISALMFSVATVYAKRITRDMEVMVVTGYSLFVGGILLMLSGKISGGNISNFTAASAALLIYLAVLSAAAFSLWNLLIKYNKVGTVSVYNFLTPVFGAILSAIFLNENILSLKNLIALVLVCFGIWMVNKVR